MRYLVLLCLVACAKSPQDKQRDIDQCSLKYSTGKLKTCLVIEHGWKEADAYFAQLRAERGE